MKRKIFRNCAGIAFLTLIFQACSLPSVVTETENKNVPEQYVSSTDTMNSAQLSWKDYFDDPYLTALIDTALRNNQELNITLQEIQIAQSEVRVRKGEYLPKVGLLSAAGVEKVGRYTSQGANDANTEIANGEEFPEPLPDFLLAARASWEVDIWKKLRNAKKSAMFRYLSSVEGKNFMVTQLVAEIANSYYELLTLDNQLAIVKRNIDIQTNALEIVRLQKQAAKVTELAVRKFEAEVLKNRSLKFEIQQQITVTENKLNYLVGRFPQTVDRVSVDLTELTPKIIQSGIPSQLLENRPDIRQAELELQASKLDIKVAKAAFYPALRITASFGDQAATAGYFLKTPESLLYSVAGDLLTPLVNRNALKANYIAANAKQNQAVYNYERSVLTAFIEVSNQLANMENLRQSYDLKSQQVKALTESISISTDLFKNARADYMEVLLTQRDALESKFELVETRKQQLNALVDIYKALGGGWN